MRDRYLLFLFGCVLSVLVWSGIGCFDFLTWLLEVLPAIAGLIVISISWRRFPLTTLLCTLIAIHMIILAVGGHYTYARVPAGDWVKEWFHMSRNHYDRLGHIAQGFVPAMIAREIFLRLNVVAKRGWRNFLIICVCLAISAFYELIEWATALVLGQASDEFLGTQGDHWDTQADMFLALFGACVSLLTLHRWHDHQLAAIERKVG